MSDYALCSAMRKKAAPVHIRHRRVMQFCFICYNFTSPRSENRFAKLSRSRCCSLQKCQIRIRVWRKEFPSLRRLEYLMTIENSFTSALVLPFFGAIVFGEREMILEPQLIVSESNIWLVSGTRNHSGRETDDWYLHIVLGRESCASPSPAMR